MKKLKLLIPLLSLLAIVPLIATSCAQKQEPSYFDTWLTEKKVENENILKNLYISHNRIDDYTSPKELVFEKIDKFKDKPELFQTINDFLLYAYIGTNENIYISWFSPITDTRLVNKVFNFENFKADIIDNDYKLWMNKITVCDATPEFPTGDPRTLATLDSLLIFEGTKTTTK